MFDYNKPIFESANITYWHNKGFTGKNIVIAVMDTNNKAYDYDNVIEPIQPLYETEGHSTKVCAVLREIVPNATIINLPYIAEKKIKDASINYIIEHKDKIDIINCSFKSPFTMTDFKKIEPFRIPIIAASGNDSSNDTIDYPAKLEYTIAIGAYDFYQDKPAFYSNAGPELDAVAYDSVMYRLPQGGGTTFTGTSCAAPVATGMIALYLEWIKRNGHRKLDFEDVLEFIRNNTIDKLENGFDFKTGHGLFILPKEFTKPKERVNIMFEDIKGHWAEEDINYIISKGLMKGYQDNTFKPDNQITRAEVATILARLLKGEYDK